MPGPSQTADIRRHIYRPEHAEEPLAAIYHIHASGYICASAMEFEFVQRLLVRTLQWAIVAVDYRLVPEQVFPAAIEDCCAGLRWTKLDLDLAHGCSVEGFLQWKWRPSEYDLCGTFFASSDIDRGYADLVSSSYYPINASSPATDRRLGDG